jgi:SAM-dependent methyltransferase
MMRLPPALAIAVQTRDVRPNRIFDSLRVARWRVAPHGTRRDRVVGPLVRRVRPALERLVLGAHLPRAHGEGRIRHPAHVPPRRENFLETRARLSARFIRGAGLEIGGLHQPLPTPYADNVLYVDRLPLAQLRETYPELAGQPLIEPDIIDDGERLTSLGERSVDFVIANHFIEHCQDPIGTIHHLLRVLKPGGVLFMAVPDKRSIFDRPRPLTSLEHVVRDHEEGPAWSMRSHFEEWVNLVDASKSVEELIAEGTSIHFHVWTPSSFIELLEYCRKSLCFPFELEVVDLTDGEFIVVARRTDALADSPNSSARVDFLAG